MANLSNISSPPSAEKPGFETKMADATPRLSQDSISISSKQDAGNLPYRPFPASMELYANWDISKPRIWHIRETGSRERLFAVQQHTGLSGRGPLLSAPGSYIYNGPETSDGILAAIGDESMASARVLAFNSNSVIMLPPIEPTGTNRFTNTKMVPRSSKEHGATFQFTIEIGHDLRKETFEWRKLAKGDEDYGGAGGYRLVALPQRTNETNETNATQSESASAVAPEVEGEKVAVLTFISMLKTFTHAFSLRLVGNAAKGVYGDRCVLAIVLTALRLLMLRMKGRTSQTVVKTGEKIHGNSE